MKQIILDNKQKLKYKDYDVRGDKITVLGIGNKAIKYSINDGEEQFAFYDSWEAKLICKEMIKSFDNEMWNEEVRACIEAQKKYCKNNKVPHFASEDGFCFSCGKQIYSQNGRSGGRDIEYASTQLITGCPHCHRSYCD